MQLARILMICISAILCCAVQLAAQDELPDSLSGFIKPGMNIGLKSYENNPNMELTIFSNAHYKVLLDAQTMTFEELKAKNAKVAQEAEAALQQFKDSFPRRIAELPQDKTYAEPLVQINVPRLFYATVIKVGSDYVLLKCDQGVEKNLNQAIAIDRISRIRWDSGQFQFNVSSKVVEKYNRTKP